MSRSPIDAVITAPFTLLTNTVDAIGNATGSLVAGTARRVGSVVHDVGEMVDDVEDAVEDGAEFVGDVVEEGQDLVEDALGLHRRVWEGADGHVQIEVRGVDDPGAVGLRRQLKAALERVESVRWAEVNAITRRVAIAVDPTTTPVDTLLNVVDGVEKAFGVTRRTGEPGWEDPGAVGDHPSDIEPVHRTIATLAGNTVALGASVTGRLTRAPRLPIEVAGLASLVDQMPWVRSRVEGLIGTSAADLLLPLLSASANGMAQGSVGILVDLMHQGSLLTELQARRRVWERREPDLYLEHDEDGVDPPVIGPRPVPLPGGPIEHWSNRSALTALAGAGIAAGLTRSPRRGADIMLAGLPKAARLGREGFATQLGRTLAARGVIPLDGTALRRLDRIDTVVLDSDTMLTGRQEITGLVPFGDVDADEVHARATRLVRQSPGARSARNRRWRLRRFDDAVDAGAGLPRGAKARAADFRSARATPHVLMDRDVVVAVVGVVDQMDPAAEVLIRAVRRAGFRLVLAGRHGELHRRIDHDVEIPAGRAMGAAVRDLQAEGAAVAVIARRGTNGLAAADVGINIARPSGRPSWGGDLLCGPDLAEAVFLVDACAVAAEVSRRSAMFAAAGSTLGGAAAVLGTTRDAGARTLAMVNGAALGSFVAGTWAALELSRRPRPAVVDPTPWHELELTDVYRALETRPTGLSTNQARARRRAQRSHQPVGEVIEPFLAELNNPLNPILGAGAGLSALAGSTLDAAMVAGLIGVNTAVGGVQRLRTDRALASMMDSAAITTRVIRDGREQEVTDRELVRGDVVRLEVGETVPADCRVLDALTLEVDESRLTGESLPVAKDPAPCRQDHLADRSCMLYEGTTIAAGEVRAAVVATGEQTEANRGLAAAMERDDAPESGVEVRLRQLTHQIVPFAGVAAAGVVGAGLLRRWPVRDLVGTGVSLAVASVPEGLPFIATAAQLASVRRLARRNAVVRNARTIEALGRVDVLCFDKTGTLTEGRVQLNLVSDGVATEAVDALTGGRCQVVRAAMRATASNGDRLDLIDQAIAEVAEAAGLSGDHDDAPVWEPTAELPFEANRGWHAVLGRSDGELSITVKGSPESVLPHCGAVWRDGALVGFDRAELAAVSERVDELAATGYRVLAVAQRGASDRDELPAERIHDLELLGLLAFSDPVRATAAEALRGVRAAGVQTVMITGDHPSTAEAIAAGLDMLTPQRGDDPGAPRLLTLTGGDIDRMDDDELVAVIESVAVFARVTPSQKVRVVQAFNRAGRVVAMTGDGANDAPAIRLADVGVAMGQRGSAAARDAADLVVTDDRLETIIDALAEGRALWGSVREAIGILVGGNLGEVGFTVLSSVFSRRAPMNARQFLLVNLMTDLAPAMAVAVRPPDDLTAEQLLREGPEASLGEALDRELILRAAATTGGATAAWTLARLTGTHGRASTVALVALVGTQLGQTVMAGGRRSPLVLLTAAGSAAALAAVVQTPGLSHFFGCRPLGPVGWTIANGAAVTATLGAAVAGRLFPPPEPGAGVERGPGHGDEESDASPSLSLSSAATSPSDSEPSPSGS
jgi:cation-transporting P-type ATPase I